MEKSRAHYDELHPALRQKQSIYAATHFAKMRTSATKPAVCQIALIA
jgi:hypothetical protein